MSKTLIYGGGTINYVRNHLALCAPAFGNTATHFNNITSFGQLVLTKMANQGSSIVTNDDLEKDVLEKIKNPYVKSLFWNPAVCDFNGTVKGSKSGKYGKRLNSRSPKGHSIDLTPADKILSKIRASRPDLFIVAFKTVDKDSFVFSDSYNANTNKARGKRFKLYTKCKLANLTIINCPETKKTLIAKPCDQTRSLIIESDSRERILKGVAAYLDAILVVEGLPYRLNDVSIYGDYIKVELHRPDELSSMRKNELFNKYAQQISKDLNLEGYEPFGSRWNMRVQDSLSIIYKRRNVVNEPIS